MRQPSSTAASNQLDIDPLALVHRAAGELDDSRQEAVLGGDDLVQAGRQLLEEEATLLVGDSPPQLQIGQLVGVDGGRRQWGSATADPAGEDQAIRLLIIALVPAVLAIGLGEWLARRSRRKGRHHA